MFTMSNNDKNETESPAIIEEIIPGKNNDKTINPSSNDNNQKPIIENYNEEDSAQAVIEATEEPKKSIEKIMTEAKNQSTPQYNNQSIAAAAGSQEQTSQTSQTSRDITNNYLELQKEAIDSFQSAFIPYFQNIQNQFWNNQGYFKSISEMYSRLANNYIESAMALSTMWSEVMSSNMNFLKNANNSSSTSTSTSSTLSSVANASTMSNFEIDSGKNSDESSTNVKATFSCETCGQTFDSRQDLKEHTSITHYHTRDK
jgi:phage shock protein A